ncbi:MAG: hypothetical protein ACTSPI_17455 [Candidatus Heimdallarchaeaceae archaeon]
MDFTKNPLKISPDIPDSSQEVSLLATLQLAVKAVSVVLAAVLMVLVEGLLAEQVLVTIGSNNTDNYLILK